MALPQRAVLGGALHGGRGLPAGVLRLLGGRVHPEVAGLPPDDRPAPPAGAGVARRQSPLRQRAHVAGGLRHLPGAAVLRGQRVRPGAAGAGRLGRRDRGGLGGGAGGGGLGRQWAPAGGGVAAGAGAGAAESGAAYQAAQLARRSGVCSDDGASGLRLDILRGVDRVVLLRLHRPGLCAARERRGAGLPAGPGRPAGLLALGAAGQRRACSR
mmetsp:Transcript_1683/g.7346  ORF Transcript_1683/g.7346 Transcript_1683/m.7346 type:complete len:213 (-) Transcript_1683:875-1513(-)